TRWSRCSTSTRVVPDLRRARQACGPAWLPCKVARATMTAADRLRGVIPAIPTPFTADGGAVEEDALRRVIRHLGEGGVHGVMTTGGTGEFPHLSREERRRVTEIVVSEAAGAVPIYAGTAACSTLEAIQLAEDAAAAGADSAILTPPFYFQIP